MAFTPGTVVIGQSGGPTAVINQTLIGVAKACLQRKHSRVWVRHRPAKTLSALQSAC